MAVTEADVIAVADTGLTEEQVTPFLTTARAIVSERVPNNAYGAATLDAITAHLAAMLISTRDPLLTSEGVDGTSRSFHIPIGEGLDAYPAGRVVKMLDFKGYLRSGVTAGFDTAGMPRTVEQVNRFWENEDLARIE